MSLGLKRRGGISSYNRKEFNKKQKPEPMQTMAALAGQLTLGTAHPALQGTQQMNPSGPKVIPSTGIF